MAKFKIVHIITSLKTGEAEQILFDLVRKMDSDLFENHVIYFHNGPFAEKIRNLNLPIYKIEGLICKYDPLFFFRIFKLVKKIKPDCIHSSLWSANFLSSIISRITGYPLVSALHLAANFESVGKNTFFRTLLDRITMSTAKKIVVVSNTMINEIKKSNCDWFPFDKMQVIKNGIDIDYIQKKANSEPLFREHYNITDRCFVIGSVGRFVPRKNQQLLIQSFYLLKKDFKDIKLILIGSGPQETFLRKKVEELNLINDVIFIHTDEAYKFYKLFDCFVLSSNHESFGLVILEAMVFNLTCVVTSPSKDHEIITNNVSGYITKPNDEIALYKKLKDLYTNKDKRHKIGTNAKENVLKNFNLNKMVNEYSNLFIKICNKQI